ncbi:MAG: gliding motility-associated C-terminal domain-containing protein, partial [Bacteroidia bacterium]|nr:gliding motility-associated C-terminal domain-containing protein [Bacteroidia bacterium]MDW8334601.1 gliding motility-associated C-terminal domain-containing protein [Bacteroidia bacterium]
DSAGCRWTGPIFSLAEPPPLEALTVAVKAVRCAGEKNGYAVFRVTGGTPFEQGRPYRVFFAGALRPGEQADTLVELSGGSYTVPVRDANGCETTFAFVVPEAEPLVVTPSTLKPETCRGDRDGEIVFNVSGGATPYRFSWNHDENLDAPSASNLTPGRYVLTVSDAYGCTRKGEAWLEGGYAWAGDDRNLCVEDGLSSPMLIGTGQPPGGQWSGPGLLVSEGAAYFDYASVGRPGAYTLTYRYGACSDEVRIEVRQALRFPLNNVCRQDAGTIPLPDPAPGYWELDGKILSANAIDLSRLNDGRHTLRYRTNDDAQCGSQTVFFIRPDPRVEFAPISETLAVGSAVIEFENLSEGASEFQWDFGDGSVSSEIHPRKQYLAPGMYTVTLNARNEDGCEGQKSRTYWVVGHGDSVNVGIPNAFSPNGDGVNDEWMIFAPSMKKQTVEVYGRWGHRVYHGEVEGFLQHLRWDGTYLGQPVPEGVFVYKYAGTTHSGNEIYRVGTVTIIR